MGFIGPKVGEVFQKLKAAVVKPPVLALLDFSQHFCIECDASSRVVGAMLLQQGHLITYFSQALKGRNLAMSTYI